MKDIYEALRSEAVADTPTTAHLQRLEEKFAAAEQRMREAERREREAKDQQQEYVAAAEQRTKEAERREREAKDQQQEYRAETNKTYTLIGIALLSIVMFTLGRATSHWMDLNAELRDVRERIAVMEALQNPSPSSSVQQGSTASPPAGPPIP